MEFVLEIFKVSYVKKKFDGPCVTLARRPCVDAARDCMLQRSCRIYRIFLFCYSSIFYSFIHTLHAAIPSLSVPSTTSSSPPVSPTSQSSLRCPPSPSPLCTPRSSASSLMLSSPPLPAVAHHKTCQQQSAGALLGNHFNVHTRSITQLRPSQPPLPPSTTEYSSISFTALPPPHRHPPPPPSLPPPPPLPTRLCPRTLAQSG